MSETMETIKEAKQYLRLNFEKGVKCPCCDQLVKLYIRKFNSGMAFALALIYTITLRKKTEWIHINEEFVALKENPYSLDYNKLQLWGLIEKRIGKRNDGSLNTGYWKITDMGRDFVHNKISIKNKVRIYETKTYGYLGDEIKMSDFKTSFNYDELMNEWKNYIN